MKTAVLFVYLAAVSLVGVIVTVADKLRAKRGAWRVSENTLMLLAGLGGSAAMLCTMLLIRHKTRHVKFMLGIPIMILMQIPVAAWIILRL